LESIELESTIIENTNATLDKPERDKPERDKSEKVPVAEKVFPVFDKATLNVLRNVTIDDALAVQQAAKRARAAQPAWAALSPKERGRLLKKARKEMVKARHEIITALGLETGKSPIDTYGEFFGVCQDIGHLAKHAPRWLKPQHTHTRPLFGKKGLIFYKPYGVVGVIAPWNAPLNLAIGDVLPALMAGNTAIVKPSEITPLAVNLAIGALNRVLPKGVLQVINGYGQTGAALVEQVDMIAVTGSCETGKRVMEAASKNLIPVLLELGGKDPMIVLQDADLDRAARAAAWGSCFMTGQVCMSIERIYVENAVAKEFQAKLVEQLRQLRTGPQLSTEQMDYGPFIGSNQINIVEDHLQDALARGAKLVIGGQRIQAQESGIYFAPTLLTDVDHSMKIMTEETFGPVAGLMVVNNATEAIALANDSKYGLSASIWTRDIPRGIAFANQLESGNVCINDCILSAGVPSLPFGGVKQSGVGSRHGGADGVRVFCQKQSIMVEQRARKSEFSWFPYAAKTPKQLDKIIGLLYGW